MRSRASAEVPWQSGRATPTWRASPLARLLPPTEVLGILLESGQLGQSVVTYQKLRKRVLGRFVQYAGEQIPQALALGRQRLAD